MWVSGRGRISRSDGLFGAGVSNGDGSWSDEARAAREFEP